MMMTCQVGLVDIVLLMMICRERSDRSGRLAASNALGGITLSGVPC